MINNLKIWLYLLIVAHQAAGRSGKFHGFKPEVGAV
jgi:hypothetical protein